MPIINCKRTILTQSVGSYTTHAKQLVTHVQHKRHYESSQQAKNKRQRQSASHALSNDEREWVHWDFPVVVTHLKTGSRGWRWDGGEIKTVKTDRKAVYTKSYNHSSPFTEVFVCENRPPNFTWSSLLKNKSIKTFLTLNSREFCGVWFRFDFWVNKKSLTDYDDQYDKSNHSHDYHHLKRYSLIVQRGKCRRGTVPLSSGARISSSVCLPAVQTVTLLVVKHLTTIEYVNWLENKYSN